MSSKERLLECLKIEDRLKRQVSIAAIITEALEPLGITPVVVGGLAVEFYTLGQYSTMDIDFVGAINVEMKKIMSELGFVRDGRYWRVPGTDIMTEFPSDELDGSVEKVKVVEYEGKKAYFIGIDDLILNRSQEAKHWKDLDSEQWAMNLMLAYYDDMDWPYCHKTANKLDCLDKFEEIQRKVKSIKNQMDKK
ncbi:MAG: hypothetical protein ACOY4Q_06480 [Bacillota bacterium]